MNNKTIVSEDQKPDYGIYKLNFNPFPISAVNAGGTPFPLYAPTSEEHVGDFITRTYQENQYAGMLVIGDYGFGKTYTLRWLEKEVNEKYSQRNSEAACAIYIENPLSTPRELISSMISHFGTNKYLTLLWGLVTREFRKKYEQDGKAFLNQFRDRQLGLYDKDFVFELLHEAGIMDPMRLLRRLCDELNKTKQFKLNKFSIFAYESVISSIFGPTEIAHALSKFNDKGFNATLSDWVATIEHKVSKKGIYIGYSDVEFFRSTLRVFQKSGYKRVYLILDEFEDIHENLKKEQLSQYLRTLRDCIDANQDMLALVIAMKPSIVQRIELTYPAFINRFPFSYRIDLAGIMKEAVENFVCNILKIARKEEFHDMGIQPFAADGLAQIYELTGPNPRLILQICSELLFEAAKTERRSIDKEFIYKYYTMGKPSTAIALQSVWITKKVEAKIKKEFDTVGGEKK